MNPSPEFFIETLPPGSKSVYRLTLPFAGGLDQLTGQIVLASSGLSSKEEVNLAIGEWLHDGRLFVPVLAARGAKPGATFVVTGGVHGDEYEGMEAIYRTFEMLSTADAWDDDWRSRSDIAGVLARYSNEPP